MRANATELGLAAGVFSNDHYTLQRVGDALEAGTIYHNCYNLGRDLKLVACHRQWVRRGSARRNFRNLQKLQLSWGSVASSSLELEKKTVPNSFRSSLDSNANFIWTMIVKFSNFNQNIRTDFSVRGSRTENWKPYSHNKCIIELLVLICVSIMKWFKSRPKW